MNEADNNKTMPSDEDEVVRDSPESESGGDESGEDESMDKEADASPQKSENHSNGIGGDGTETVATPTQGKGEYETGTKSASKNTPKSSRSKKSPTSASKKKSYLEMVHEAIVALKDRTGSSIPAICKWILSELDHIKSTPPNTFKNCVNNAIKQGMKNGRFVKVKSSYKINSAWTKKQKAAEKAKEAEKKRREIKRKKEMEKLKLEKEKKKKQQEEEAKKQAELERKKKEAELTPEQRAAQEERKKKKEAAEARAKYIAERLRKRRFPMEDTKLHAEDKELGLKPPDDVTKRPTLPYTLGCIVPFHQRGDVRKCSVAANASNFGNGDWLGNDDTRGLITDALHVYHFFCGDVRFIDEKYPVPQFSVKTLLYAIDEIINGNAKAAKALPPLITHLFTTALRVLTSPDTNIGKDKAKEDDTTDPVQNRLQKDLEKLHDGLNPISWSQICLFYMDLMERYYKSDYSIEHGVLIGESNLDMGYLWDEHKTHSDGGDIAEDGRSHLPKNYNAYLGGTNGSIVKGYRKLQKQIEPWNLSAEELMALLRVLIDDIIAKRSDLAEDISGRTAKLHELQKSRNSAMYKLRRVKCAYEGTTKKTTKPKNESTEEGGEAPEEGGKAPDEGAPVPTATKQQLITAEKAYAKASEAFDNGIKKLVSRSDPIGYDRHFNAYYFFPHDPELLHVEELKNSSLPPELKRLHLTLNPNSSWRVIDTKSLFDQFLGGLDIRGIRENELFNYCSGLTILKKKLHDETKDKSRAAMRSREKEDMERRVENARNACADDGRRSGRLAAMAHDELQKVLAESDDLEKMHAAEEQREKEELLRSHDYKVLTGLEMLSEFEKANNCNANSTLAAVPCHRLWVDTKANGNGTLQVLIEALLMVEDEINQLSPWKTQDTRRELWRAQLNDVSKAWIDLCSMKLGPTSKDTEGDPCPKKEAAYDNEEISQTPKKQKLDQPLPSASEKACIVSIVSTVKQCLIDLELRMFELSGMKAATEAANAVDDSGSSDGEDDGSNKRVKCWKWKINALKQVPTPRYVLIRDIIVAAIIVARKSHHTQVAADLKQALQLHRPKSALDAKQAAIAVLEKYGGYDGVEDDDVIDFEELVQVDTGDKKLEDATVESMICDEVVMMTGSLGGEENADRTDWFDAVKGCKSISRLATLTQYFISNVNDLLVRIKGERDILDSVLGTKGKKSRTNKKKHDSSTPVWCNASVTNKIVKCKVKGYPWWPARVCKALDTKVEESLEEGGYTLISFVGEPNMYVVSDNEVKDFAEDIEEDYSQWDQSIMDNLHESTKMARKLWRTQNRGVASPWEKKSKQRFEEEKKTAR
mmetsp:Transcript_2102/g.3894  ORF Transcript_2102/g.3894 Transcript_2102/m.3894 type:complete len:1326 (+) Transcript_2102:117-4094(+)